MKQRSHMPTRVVFPSLIVGALGSAASADVVVTSNKNTSTAPEPFVVANNDLLQLGDTTFTPGNALNPTDGPFRNDEGGSLDPQGGTLRDGLFGQGNTPFTLETRIIGNGGMLTYTFADPYDLTQIGTYTAWSSGRDDQNYSVYTSGNGIDFAFLARVDVGANGENSQVLITDSTGTLATGVRAVRFIMGTQHPDDFDNIPAENNGAGYRELDVIGVPSGPIAPPTWKNDVAGSWLDVNRWTNHIPNGVDEEAQFLGVITTSRSVFADLPVTAGTLRFNNANSYVIGGAGSLTIQVSSGAGLIDVQAGPHKINLPIFIASNTNINVAGGATLTIADPMTIRAGRTVTKTGTVLIQAPLTLEAGAVLSLTGGRTDLFGAPSLGANAKIDVKNTTVTVDYRGQTSPATTIRTQLASGYAAGAWNGPGIGTSAPLTVGGKAVGVGWRDDPATQSIRIKYTYVGDSNLDGQVDITDLGALATAWQTAGVWANGDFDYSNFIDITDLGALATNWQAGVGSPLRPGDLSLSEALASLGLPSVAVPEPASLGAVAMCLAVAAPRRRRTRWGIVTREVGWWSSGVLATARRRCRQE
jgi:hypothetical protein